MFIITKDYICNGADEGTVGPSNLSDSDETILRAIAKGKPVKDMEVDHFYMYDDDGERYYAGYHVGEDPFEPLDCSEAKRVKHSPSTRSSTWSIRKRYSLTCCPPNITSLVTTAMPRFFG